MGFGFQKVKTNILQSVSSTLEPCTHKPDYFSFQTAGLRASLWKLIWEAAMSHMSTVALCNNEPVNPESTFFKCSVSVSSYMFSSTLQPAVSIVTQSKR